MAFLDINPLSPGHTLVIPKAHYRWVWDVPDVGKYFEVVKKVAKAQQKAFGTDWILSKIVGVDVYHAHIWIYPPKPDLTQKFRAIQKILKLTLRKLDMLYLIRSNEYTTN